MNTPTWKAAEPPKLPPATRWQNARGYLRVGSIIALTLVLFVFFMTGRFFRKVLGRWVTYHYLIALVWARICLRLLSLKPVVIGTPIDLSRVIKIDKPATRIAYDLDEYSDPSLSSLIAEKIPG